MGKMNALIHSFNSGEISKAGLARVDNERVRLCAEVQENIFPYTIGKGLMRPGTKHLGVAVSATTLDNSPPRLIPFTKSLSTKALLELTYTPGSISTGQMRVWFNDAVITYGAVTSTVGGFSTYTTAVTGGATVTAASTLTMQCPNQGGTVIAYKLVTTTSANSEHVLYVDMDRGSVEFRVGSTLGGDEYVSKTTLSEGAHFLSFTPAGSYYVYFFTKSKTQVIVGSCSIYNSTAKDLLVPSPWAGTSLRQIRYDQSLDTVFLTVPDNQPYKIERRGTRSWSVVKFQSDNGPFMTSRSDTNVKLKPAATRGNTTLTASSAFFGSDSTDAGKLFRLTHDKMNATFGLGAEGEYTRPWRVTGVNTTNGNDRDFTVTVSGTWAGTLNIQRSFDNETSGYSNFGANAVNNATNPSSITANGTYTISESDDNAIVWYRVIFTTYTSGSVALAVVYDGYGETGVCRLTHVNSSTSANVEVITDFTDVSYTENWQEGEWNVTRGYPTAVCLFDGRLWFARRDRFWGSESDNYYSFDETVVGDSASIQRDVATGGTFSEIQWLLPLQRLMFGTSGQEASARSSSFDEPLTPTNITLKDASSQGSAAISPLKIDSRGIFVHRSGKKIYQLLYSIDSNDYTANDLMGYNETIGTALEGVRVTNLVDDDIVEIAVQRQPETYIWVLRDDGVIPVLIFNPEEKVSGWFKFIPGRSYASGLNDMSYLANDRILSVCVLPGEVEDSVYFVVQRRSYLLGSGEIPPYYHYNIEKLETHANAVYKVINSAASSTVNTYNGLYQCDSYVTGTVVASGDPDNPFKVATIATHLSGYMATGFSDTNTDPLIIIGPFYNSAGAVTHYGPILKDVNDHYVDDSGNIFFSSEDANHTSNLLGDTVTIGLPYYGKYKSAKLAYGAQGGSALLQKKRVGYVGLLASDYNADGIEIGSDFDASEAMDSLPQIEDEAPINTETTLPATLDSDLFPFPGSWDTDSRVCVRVNPGYSATLNGIVVGVETNEKI